MTLLTEAVLSPVASLMSSRLQGCSKYSADSSTDWLNTRFACAWSLAPAAIIVRAGAAVCTAERTAESPTLPTPLASRTSRAL